MIKQTKNTLILLVLLITSACGYHLRGSVDLSEDLKNIYLQGASSQLTKLLKKTLKSSNGQLVDKVEQAGVVIKIEKEKMDRRVLSLDSSGRANEYELLYVVIFNLFDNKGKQLAGKQVVEVNRDYFNDQAAVLAKNNEEQVIREEMYRQAVKSILNRAKALLEKSKK
ncbi:MAG: hypothetical protein KAT04_03890 [Methylococcales bacterium]|nr:hypothetical protein [Methylococcales bacterium]